MAAIICTVVMGVAVLYMLVVGITGATSPSARVIEASRRMKLKRRDAPPIVVPVPLVTYRPTRWPPTQPRTPAVFTPINHTSRAQSPDRPAPIWHDALSHDATEHELLAALRTAPNDAANRMVYADWLEQAGALSRAAFVRGNNDLELRIAARDTDPAWRAITSHQNVRCTYPGCPARWSGYRPTADERVRCCPHCDRTLRYCLDAAQARRAKDRGEVPVLDLANLLPPVPQVTKPYAFDLSSMLDLAFRGNDDR